MSILEIVHAFLPQSTAGVEGYTFRQARTLQQIGHEVLVLSAVHDLAAPPYSVRRRRHQAVDVAEIVNVDKVLADSAPSPAPLTRRSASSCRRGSLGRLTSNRPGTLCVD